MSILMLAELPGITSEQFEVVFAPVIDQLKAFPGFIANASGPVPKGYQVTEVWDSQGTTSAGSVRSSCRRCSVQA